MALYLPSASIGVVGAGRMGAGIALVAAAAGHNVFLYDKIDGATAKAIGFLRSDLEKLVARGKLTQAEAALRLSRISEARALDQLSGCSLIIEAIIEELEAKAALFAEVEKFVGADAILATNTSSLSVTALGARLARPERFVGMHFFNPAPVMPLVEIVSGAATVDDVATCVFETARAWGKKPVRCGSTPGFIVNRIARPFYGESLLLLAERASTPATLDAIFREAGGFRMGPFELMDMIGHDVNFSVTSSVYDAYFQDPRYKPSPLQRTLIEAGWLGRKSGKGFYDYAEASPPAYEETVDAKTPGQIAIEGDLGAAAALGDRIRAHFPGALERGGDGVIMCDGARLVLTDGEMAAARELESGQAHGVFDLALDYRTAKRIAIAASPTLSKGQRAGIAGLFQTLGIAPSFVDDTPGLPLARTVCMLANEAAWALSEGLASAEDIDLAMIAGANYPLGPLHWADQIGAAYIVGLLDTLGQAYPTGRYRPAPFLRRMAFAGTTFFAEDAS